MAYCTSKGLSRPRWWVRISISCCVALTSSSRCTGFPERRARTNTILITTSMLMMACRTRPTRYGSMGFPSPCPSPRGRGAEKSTLECLGRGRRGAAALIHATIDLQAVAAAINDVDQTLGVKLDRGRPPQKPFNFAILGDLALMHVVRVGWEIFGGPLRQTC